MTKAILPENDLARLDRESHLHPFTSIAEHMDAGPCVIEGAKGARIRDAAGKEYLDAMAGLWCVNVGYGREEIGNAMAEQARKLCYYHSFMAMASEPTIRLAGRLSRMVGGDSWKIFFGNSGSDANDTNIKIIWYYNNILGRTRKKKILARHGAYHGVTVATGSLTGLPAVHAGFDLPIERIGHVERPHHYWNAPAGMTEREFSAHLARKLDERIESEGPDTVAAFFVEPVMGAGGVIVPPDGYFEAIEPVLEKHDVLLVADEVICGFGRLGKLFGSHYYGISPDLMTIAKGLTSGYIPMSASLVSEKIWNVLRDGSPKLGPFAHGFTYTGHPIAAAAAMANLDILEGEGLTERAARIGTYFQGRLRESFSAHPLVGEVRGIGMIAAVELVANKEKKEAFDLKLGVARRLYAMAREEGLICRPILNSLAFSPPLIVGESEVDEIVEKFTRGLARLADALKHEGIWRG